ncbi:MAG TPA: DNA-3-methyladenine glycosylase 2 family protein [Planctomycetota bacterium]|nr:DNA-3-methyladenine glycosylase 2 family protein [Planctomycetota bacterium]
MRDPVLARIIRERGFRPLPRLKGTHFSALARSIVYQQLAPKSAAPIWRRVLLAMPGAPRALPSVRVLRAAGLSRQKASYVRGIARAFADGRLSGPRLARMPSEALIERLTELDGVGVWTAQMFLIFRLGRTDVLPLNDYGLQRAVKLAYRRRPTEAVLRELGGRWAPYQAVACWQLWKWLDT